MRAPPAAVWHVKRDARWQLVHALLFALATLALLAWLGQHGSDRWPEFTVASDAGVSPAMLEALLVILGAAITLISTVWGWRLGRQAEGRVLWTGSQWRWQLEGTPGAACDVSVEAMFDTGNWLLLRLRPHPSGAQRLQAPGWISVRGPRGLHAGERTQWAAFRAAVYSAASRSGGLVQPNRPRSLNDRSGL